MGEIKLGLRSPSRLCHCLENRQLKHGKTSSETRPTGPLPCSECFSKSLVTESLVGEDLSVWSVLLGYTLILCHCTQGSLVGIETCICFQLCDSARCPSVCLQSLMGNLS